MRVCAFICKYLPNRAACIVAKPLQHGTANHSLFGPVCAALPFALAPGAPLSLSPRYHTSPAAVQIIIQNLLHRRRRRCHRRRCCCCCAGSDYCAVCFCKHKTARDEQSRRRGEQNQSTWLMLFNYSGSTELQTKGKSQREENAPLRLFSIALWAERLPNGGKQRFRVEALESAGLKKRMRSARRKNFISFNLFFPFWNFKVIAFFCTNCETTDTWLFSFAMNR